VEPVRDSALQQLVETAATSRSAERSGRDAPPHFQPRRRISRRPRGTPIALMMAPMVDMSFTFLVFFVATTRFDRPEGLLKSNLPAVSGSGPALPFSPVVVRLQRTGAGHDDFRVRIDGFDDAPDRLAGLPEYLRGVRQLPAYSGETPVVLVADNDMPWDHVVGCWNAVLRAGYEKIAFAEP
jgi:biopolymer transport protein ExbD